ncbi:ABC transporter permease [Dysgonomonas sp. 25]|uniref:ABC transporter permease n=1 Tax=Dysgonomonas sp. 25 TaxID=2302933 RepID=UPI0013D66F64|nr:ABC transporter permease [Dysgonomonas sp. 25]NDV68480.1 ABC transporter permease [Dysgonomonas sp. 25]
MFDLDYWEEIWSTITRNKVRSILTGFGVFLGIFMLILLLGIGNAFKGGMMKIVQGVAPNSCYFYTDRTSEAFKGFRKGRYWNMNNQDLVLLKEKAKTVEHISPMLFGARSDKNMVRGRKSGTYGMMGVYPANFIVQIPEIIYGRVINEMDVKENRKVCVIGKDVYESLFEIGENPIGSYIRANGIYFQVVGVVNSTSEIAIGGKVERTVYIPFSTMQKAFNQGDAVHFLAVTAKPGYPAAVVEQEVKEIIKANHSIAPTDEKAMGSFNAEMIFNIFQAIFLGVNIIAIFVGGGSLLSGIIGICNIMLVTVRERTREIGIRRALGAKPMTIVKQILSESALLTAVSGIAGLLTSVTILIVIRYLMENALIEIPLFVPPLVSFATALLAMIVLIFSGILSGILPAFRALRIKAIDAIREE